MGMTGCANLGGTGAFVRQWGVRGIGAVGAFALHEACHLAVGAALGADISAEFRENTLYLEFADLSPKEHQAVAIVGNACTGIAAEIIVDTGAHKKSDLAWGMAAFHSINVFGYAFSNSGDAEHWSGSGGSETTWKALNAIHASRIGTQLAYDSKYGQYLRQRWSADRIKTNPVDLDPLEFTARSRAECFTAPVSSNPSGTQSAFPPSIYLQGPDCESLPWAVIDPASVQPPASPAFRKRAEITP